ncbi:MAG: flagellar hook-basal body complex protein FliE [Treponema sp.]|nr:flagellar hook-basal body complex protein FliE [Treponema sp.]
MKIPEFGQLQMTRTNQAHTGVTKLSDIAGAPLNSIPSSAENGIAKTRKSFQDYLMEAMSTMNQQQMDVDKLSEQMVTDPDSVDIHDVTIAMSKARMSLNLAQSVIDRLVTGWNEISTSR